MKLKYLLLLLPVLLGIGIAQATYQPVYPIREASVLDLGWEAVVPEKKQEAESSRANEGQLTPPAPKVISVASPLLKLVNQARSGAGLDQVAESADLTASAQAESNSMAGPACTMDNLVHSGYPYEIIGCTTHPDPNTWMVNAWIDSPAHNRIMFGNFTQGGCSGVTSNGVLWGTCWFK